MTELPPLHDQSDYERLFNECKKRRVRDKARIAELEAELKRCEQLRDEYHRLAGERPDTARIAALEAVLKQTTGQREYAATQRADKAEAHASDCKRLVTACENDLDAERMKRREVEAELKSAKHLNAKWMDERTTALMDKEKAEAALAERDRMLMTLFMEERDEQVDRGQDFFMPSDIWLADLKARACAQAAP